MNGSDGMFKYEEIVLERVSLPVGAGCEGRGGVEPEEDRAPSPGLQTQADQH